MKFYFTNPTKDRHRGQYVRLNIEGQLKGILTLDSPFYDKAGQPTPEIAALDRGEVPVGISDNDIVEWDLEKVQESDGLVAFVTNRSSWGSIQECCIAYREMHKPVYIIFDPMTRAKCEICKTYNPNDPDHPWAKKHSTRQFQAIEHFVNFIKEQHRANQELAEHNEGKEDKKTVHPPQTGAGTDGGGSLPG